MKLQAISVCVNYSDFFIHSVLENKKLFDKWIVVTDKDDTNTEKLCQEHGLVCVKTDAFYTRGIFNKFAGINEGLVEIDSDAWVLFLDADMVLHEQTRRVLDSLNLDKTFIYGMDRLNCDGIQRWNEFKQSPGILKDYWLLHSAGLEFGARLVHLYGYEKGDGKFAGWGPLGFFQLAHRSQFESYPENSLGADHCDLLFTRHWPRDKRMLIPELYAIHLESENAWKGINWRGRKSAPFVDTIKIAIDEIIESLQNIDQPVVQEISEDVPAADELVPSTIVNEIPPVIKKKSTRKRNCRWFKLMVRFFKYWFYIIIGWFTIHPPKY